ncbi:unnamed protein product, partial [Prorocentrum cordatum]
RHPPAVPAPAQLARAGPRDAGAGALLAAGAVGSAAALAGLSRRRRGGRSGGDLRPRGRGLRSPSASATAAAVFGLGARGEAGQAERAEEAARAPAGGGRPARGGRRGAAGPHGRGPGGPPPGRLRRAAGAAGPRGLRLRGGGRQGSAAARAAVPGRLRGLRRGDPRGPEGRGGGSGLGRGRPPHGLRGLQDIQVLAPGLRRAPGGPGGGGGAFRLGSGPGAAGRARAEGGLGLLGGAAGRQRGLARVVRGVAPGRGAAAGVPGGLRRGPCPEAGHVLAPPARGGPLGAEGPAPRQHHLGGGRGHSEQPPAGSRMLRAQTVRSLRE